jgi:hypothetical protein
MQKFEGIWYDDFCMAIKESELREKLKQTLKDAAGSTFDTLLHRLTSLPYEGVLLATDLGVSIAATNLRAAVEFLKAVPDISKLVEAGDIRIWGEAGKRIASTSADTAIDFFQSSAAVLASLAEGMRPAVLKLINKQAALSANTAVESFKSSPKIIAAIKDLQNTGKILSICIEMARHSVKHSNDLLQAAPQVLTELKTISGESGIRLTDRALALTSAFAFRSGGTAAEFFVDLPNAILASNPEAVEKLFDITEEYLERSGGVALQYFKAASRVLKIADEEAFKRWTSLAKKVALQGNAASYHFMKASPQIVADLSARFGPDRRAQVVTAVLQVVEEIAEKKYHGGCRMF